MDSEDILASTRIRGCTEYETEEKARFQPNGCTSNCIVSDSDKDGTVRIEESVDIAPTSTYLLMATLRIAVVCVLNRGKNL